MSIVAIRVVKFYRNSAQRFLLSEINFHHGTIHLSVNFCEFRPLIYMEKHELIIIGLVRIFQVKIIFKGYSLDTF
jgi:hypothetical protein